MSRAVFRIHVLCGLIVLASLALWYRLFDLQISEHERWLFERNRNIYGREYVDARRGKITDRENRVLAKDELQFQLQIQYRDFRRQHPWGLILHLDHLLRQIGKQVELEAVALEEVKRVPVLIAGAPLAYEDSPRRFEAALKGAMRLPSIWLRKAGPLPSKLSSDLRFYLFSLLEHAVGDKERARYGSRLRLSLRFSETRRDAPIARLLAAKITGLSGALALQQVHERLLVWLRDGDRNLARLEAILLREDQGDRDEHRSLYWWLDYWDRYFARAVDLWALAYREYRGCAAPGRLRHLDLLLRMIKASGVARSAELAVLSDAPALDFAAGRAPFDEAIGRLHALPSWCLESGLPPIFGSHLRFHVFGILQEGLGETRFMAFRKALRRRHAETDSLAQLLEKAGVSREDFETALRAWLQEGWQQRKQRLAKRNGFLSWLEAVFLGQPEERDPEQLAVRLERRYSIENSVLPFQSYGRSVSFDSVVALVVGKRQRYPGFRVKTTAQRVWPRRPELSGSQQRSRLPYRFVGQVQRVWAAEGLVNPEQALSGTTNDAVAKLLHMSAADFELYAKEVENRDFARRRESRRQGIYGLERYLHVDLLRGSKGMRRVKRDREGRELAMPNMSPAQVGKEVRLTIDVDLQDLALRSLEEAARGDGTQKAYFHNDISRFGAAALTVIDAVTGEILCMAWIPQRISRPRVGTLAREADFVSRVHWQNRASGLADFSPHLGSIVKPFMILEALERGDVLEAPFPVCDGVYAYSNKSSKPLRCHSHAHWPVDQMVEESLRLSCNSFYAELGMRQGIAGISKALARVGLWQEKSDYLQALGVQALGLRLARPGLNDNFANFDKGRLGTGYGLQAAPLSVARAYAGLGTGKLPRLTLVASVDGKDLAIAPGTDLGVKPEHLARVREGLKRVPLSGGTAGKAGLRPGFRVAGKTGTAEIIIHGLDGTNAWFCGYLPYGKPRLAFCAVFYAAEREGYGQGGKIAAKAVAYFLDGMARDPKLRRYLLPRESGR